MSTQPNPPLPPGGAPGPEAGSVPSLARRRLLRGGLGAAPVLMAAAPRSVMAGGTCMTGSLYTSFSPNTTMSRSPRTYTCSGKTPEWWRDCAPTEWPATCVREGKSAIKFKDVFAPNRYGEETFLKILQKPETRGQNGMAKHLVAAILNANKYPSTPMNVVGPAVLKGVWSDYCAKNYYEPTAGVRWGCDAAPNGTGGITPWLRSTMVG